MNFPELQGQRIRLIQLDESHLEGMFEYSRDPRFYRYFEFKPQVNMEETRAYLQRLIERSSINTAHYWFIYLTGSNKVIGSIGVHDIDWRKKSGEISYGLSPAYWGQGLFGETLQLILKYLFDECDFHRVCATTREDNAPSIKALEKIGFKKEGILRDYYLAHDGQRYHAAILAVLRNEYKG